MAASRALSTRLSEDGDVAALSHEAFRLFVVAITLADDHGNLSADPNFLGARAFWQRPPKTPVADLIAEIAAAGLWSVYSDRGRPYAHLRGWAKNQKLKIPGKPAHPLPPGWTLTTKNFGKGVAYISSGPDGNGLSGFANGDDARVSIDTMGEFPTDVGKTSIVTHSPSTSPSTSGEVQEGDRPSLVEPRLSPKAAEGAAKILAALQTRPDLFGSDGLDAVAARLEVSLRTEPKADREDRAQIGLELVAHVGRWAAKYKGADVDQRIAELDTKVAYILGDLRRGSRPQPSAPEQSRNDGFADLDALARKVAS